MQTNSNKKKKKKKEKKCTELKIQSLPSSRAHVTACRTKHNDYYRL